MSAIPINSTRCSSLDDTLVEHVDSVRSSTSPPFVTTPHQPRPFVVPTHDPQRTNEEIPHVYCSPSRASSQPEFPYPGEDNFTVKIRAHFGWYEGQPVSTESTQNLIGHRGSRSRPQFNRRFSEMSMTPFEIPLPQVARFSRASREPDIGSEGDDPIAPQEEGRVAWLQAFAGFLVVFNAQGLNLSFGIFQAYYEKVMLPGTPSTKIAWIGSLQVFFLFSSALFVAPALNKGNFRMCFHGGSALLVLGIFVTSFCRNWWQLFLFQGLITGIAMGSVFASGLMVLLTYFSKRLGVATGIAAAGAPVGGIFFPLVARSSIGSIGFGGTVRFFALVSLVLMAIANILVRPKPTPQRPPSSGALYEKSQPLDKSFILMTVGMFFTFWGFFVAYYYIVLFGQDTLHMNETTAVNLLIAMNASNFVGRFLPNFISDACLGPLNTITPWTLITAMLAFCWIAATNSSGLFLISCLYGFTSSAVQSLYTSTIFSFTGRGSTAAARRLGLVLAIIGIAVLTGAPIGGALIAGSNGNYLHTQLFASITLAIGGLFFLAARVAKSGWNPDKV